MSDFFTFALLAATLRTATPLLFAAMGGLISERAGIMNIALEGMMLMGAFFSVAGTYWTGTPWIGLLIGIGAAAVAGLIHAFWCITLQGNQIVAGTAINLIAAGLTAFLTQLIWGKAGGSDNVSRLPNVFSGVNILVLVAFALVPLIHVFLFRSRAGLRTMSAG